MPSQEERDAAAHYIAQMAEELAKISAAARLDLLTYFLKMAQMEAESFLKDKKTDP